MNNINNLCYIYCIDPSENVGLQSSSAIELRMKEKYNEDMKKMKEEHLKVMKEQQEQYKKDMARFKRQINWNNVNNSDEIEFDMDIDNNNNNNPNQSSNRKGNNKSKSKLHKSNKSTSNKPDNDDEINSDEDVLGDNDCGLTDPGFALTSVYLPNLSNQVNYLGNLPNY